MRVTSLLLTAVLTLGAFPSRVQAETDVEKARRLFREGTSYYDLGEFLKAIEAYKAGYLVKQDPIFLFNIAQAYRMLKDHDQALMFYKSYLRKRPDAPNRDDVLRRIEELETTGKGSGAALHLDHAPAPTAVLPGPTERDESQSPPPVAPQPQVLHAPPPASPTPTLSTPTNLTTTTNTTTTHKDPLTPMSVDVHKAADHSPPFGAWVPWTIAGAGGALLLGSIFTGLTAQSLQSDLEVECPTRMNCSERARELQSRGKTMALTTDVLLLGGAALAVTGVAWWALRFRHPSAPVVSSEPRTSVRMSCVSLATCSVLATTRF